MSSHLIWHGALRFISAKELQPLAAASSSSAEACASELLRSTWVQADKALGDVRPCADTLTEGGVAMVQSAEAEEDAEKALKRIGRSKEIVQRLRLAANAAGAMPATGGSPPLRSGDFLIEVEAGLIRLESISKLLTEALADLRRRRRSIQLAQQWGQYLEVYGNNGLYRGHGRICS
eukprot:TRINITY_DN36883_c0_g1_i1.p1 TRINITY_DN36883_c0_g1~~TRINITY_DN36883_c0_g1_i1.p1  ORF type:complete len:177 (+),score=27.73 TRINITY_DN36883_c0_g1_i1:36-566(+)